MTRIYVPLDAAALDALAADGHRASVAFAVTPEVRALIPDADEELYEHLAVQMAAAACAGERIVLAAADVKPELVHEVREGATGQVALDAPVVARTVACFLVGDPGDVVTDDADVELSWYDASEWSLVRDLL